MKQELDKKTEYGCLISLGVLALIGDAITFIKTKEITVVEFILVPIIVAFLVYYIVCYKIEKEKKDKQ